MKKLVLCLVMAALSFKISAQSSFGLKAGLNLSTLNVADPSATYDSRTGFHAGLFFGGRINNIGFQPEVLLYTQNGDIETSAFERKYDTFLGSGTDDITDHYKSTDVAVSMGLGYDLPFGLTFDARYNLGVKDINNAANGDPVKSRVIMLSVGWNFLK
jgi:hypothetical protein